MKKPIVIVVFAFLFAACRSGNDPDVSGVKVDAGIARFDKDFFAADTTHIMQSLDTVAKKYPYFFTDFIQNIVVNGGPPDSSHNLELILRSYLAHSRPLYDSVRKRFTDLSSLQTDITNGFKHIKYYYPQYALPKVLTYSGLIGDPAVALTRESLGIGLQMYLGKDFSAYNTPEAIEKFPQYISRRFSPEYIPVNCVQSLATDIYPERTQNLSLIEQMIEKGKQWYLTSRFLPGTADSLITGFTGAQVKWCEANEGLIWNFIISHNDVYSTDQSVIQDYIGEAPKTDGMPDASPGNIGQWIGWRIVEKYAEKNSSIPLPQVIQTPARKLFEDTKYKPK